ncbi:hypothetical protein [Entomospira culicis]|uniref:Uncharacterized protein n=1 Tax=Entomospira culicis TaxID=2719989 RepID=A0A968KUD6_9SPIO|nr:hypothetical protein [Entomospira culicis]NIZ19240.1 hypothetical protein [Entomospira culicis]NIZ69454.1 hypothetical protein [Entomospira culicis]WDI36570.1 hypothetical protein PVA46_04405 [Entomospira culicis]WDI38196.1 hypothetical protein PVA47_04405 [Entomospira culicis]
MRKLIMLILLVSIGMNLYARSPRNTMEYLYFNDIKKFEKRAAKEKILDTLDYQEVLVDYLRYDPFGDLSSAKRKKAANVIFKSLKTVHYLEDRGADIKAISRSDMLAISQDLMTDALFEYILQETSFLEDNNLWVEWFSRANRITPELQHSLDLLIKEGFNRRNLLTTAQKGSKTYRLMEALIDDPELLEFNKFLEQSIDMQRADLMLYAQNAGYNVLAYSLTMYPAILKTVTHTSTYTTGGHWIATGPNGQGRYAPVQHHTRYHTFDEMLYALRDKYVDNAVRSALNASKKKK